MKRDRTKDYLQEKARKREKRMKLWESEQFEIENEVWKPIQDVEDAYLISSLGRFRILENTDKSGRLLLENTNYGYGTLPNYKKVFLTYPDGKTKCKRLHILVASAFIPNPDNKPQVNHKDGNRHNNKAANLEWATAKENIRHAVETGLYWQFGSNHYMAKFTELQVYDIFKSTDTINNLAKQYNVNYTDIWSIKTGRCWTRVTGKKYIPKSLIE